MNDLLLWFFNIFMPALFKFWIGMLFVWGIVVIYGLYEITMFVRTRRHYSRSIAGISRWVVIGMTAILGILLFISPTQLLPYYDVAGIIAIWYAILLARITMTCLKVWPILHYHQSKHIVLE